jgi:hypothetical protein
VKRYDNATLKRIVQDCSLQSSYTKMYGLAGPNANIYVQLLRDKNYSDITLFENNWDVYTQQLQKWAEDIPYNLVYDDIRNHLGKDCFYDYDFCCIIKTVEKWLPQIVRTKEYALTFSLRGCGEEETVRIFKKYSNANYMTYRDTSPMITFFSNNNYITKN